MRLGILIYDSEYRNALVNKLSSYDNDIYVNVIGGAGSDSDDCLILTDIAPESLDDKALSRLMPRTVFLTGAYGAEHSGNESSAGLASDCHRLFKYITVSEMISELSLVYNEWRGIPHSRDYSAKTIAVCSEYDSFSSDKCLTLAGQIIYMHGGSVLVIGLGFINDYGMHGSPDMNRFARLMYAISNGRERESDSFTYTDSYGVSFLTLPCGRNPMAYLNEEELRCMISGLSCRFDTVILDVGNCYRKENVSLIRESENIVYFEGGRRAVPLSEVIGREAAERAFSIKITGDAAEAMEIDECINRIFGMGDHGNIKGKNDKEIRS